MKGHQKFIFNQILLLGALIPMSCSEQNDIQNNVMESATINQFNGNETQHAEDLDKLLSSQVTSRDWKYIVIHHSASETGSVESIHEYHLSRKDSAGRPWRGIGYHFVIGNGKGMDNGKIEPTFRWREQLHGAHAGVKEYNSRGIGIVMIGNFEKSPPTEAQMSSLKNLISRLRFYFEIANSDVVGHRQLKVTACPGKLFSMPSLKLSENESSQELELNSVISARTRIFHEQSSKSEVAKKNN